MKKGSRAISNQKSAASIHSFDGIVVKGAREHNLKNIDVNIPRNKMTVITGLSGSGKSTLAFDTIYAEGQRRYVESLSAYARNFMEQLKKPEMDSITGLSPAIAIDQKTTSHNPRSTVGTVTEVYDFLRLLFARVGVPHCPEHHVPVEKQTPELIIERVMALPKGTKFYIVSPVVEDKKGEYLKEFQKWSRKGFTRARVDGDWIDLEGATKLSKHRRHTIDLLVDRLIVEDKYKHRIAESINTSIGLSGGQVKIELVDKSEVLAFSIHNTCPHCNFSLPEVEPRLFSFNNPRGACEECEGVGYIDYYYEDEEGEEIEDSYESEVCPACNGQRLRPEILAVRIGDYNIAEISAKPIKTLIKLFKEEDIFTKRQHIVADKIVKQILDRLVYIERVGASYLTLNRPAKTLSGGEHQRIRLATQVGSALVGILYVLDEPSIGLHPRDHHRLLEILCEIRDRGNTVVLVEHDEDTIRSADYIIDIGPGAGKLGGEIMVAGDLGSVCESKKSLTGQFLSHLRKIEVPGERRSGNGHQLEVIGAKGNNLKNVSFKIPLGTMTGVTGVSGSGKSTAVIETLYRHLAQHFYDSKKAPAEHDAINGVENIDKVIEINQKPIGRTPRSIPATYVGLYSQIRDLYANLPDSKIRGYKPGYFSFNVKGGRCENCQGGGAVKVEMHFMSDVYVECDQCMGTRFTAETRNIKYNSKSIADVLEMSVDEAAEFFKNHKMILRKIKTLQQVGLGYIHLGQSSTTLSGGEAQRVKLSKELSKRGTGRTLYILDEPTTGLHFEDVKKLVELLHELTDQGNTVLVIEHNLDVIKSCDYLIDMGPEGGEEGGYVVVCGSPEEVCKVNTSLTGQFLKPYLK